jgi:DNA-binding NarL/FixJ family response regulator
LGNGQIRILIVDRDPSVNDALETYLSVCEDMQVIGTAINNERAAAECSLHAPDVILLGFDRPFAERIEAILSMSSAAPEAHFILLGSNHGQDVTSELIKPEIVHLENHARGNELANHIRRIHQSWLVDKPAQAD